MDRRRLSPHRTYSDARPGDFATHGVHFQPADIALELLAGANRQRDATAAVQSRNHPPGRADPSYFCRLPAAVDTVRHEHQGGTVLPMWRPEDGPDVPKALYPGSAYDLPQHATAPRGAASAPHLLAYQLEAALRQQQQQQQAPVSFAREHVFDMPPLASPHDWGLPAPPGPPEPAGYGSGSLGAPLPGDVFAGAHPFTYEAPLAHTGAPQRSEPNHAPAGLAHALLQSQPEPEFEIIDLDTLKSAMEGAVPGTGQIAQIMMQTPFKLKVSGLTAIMGEFTRSGRWKWALDVYNGMFPLGLEADTKVFNAALTASARGKQWDSMLEIFKCMLAQRCDVDMGTNRSVLFWASQDREWLVIAEVVTLLVEYTVPRRYYVTHFLISTLETLASEAAWQLSEMLFVVLFNDMQPIAELAHQTRPPRGLRQDHLAALRFLETWLSPLLPLLSTDDTRSTHSTGAASAQSAPAGRPGRGRTRTRGRSGRRGRGATAPPVGISFQSRIEEHGRGPSHGNLRLLSSLLDTEGPHRVVRASTSLSAALSAAQRSTSQPRSSTPVERSSSLQPLQARALSASQPAQQPQPSATSRPSAPSLRAAPGAPSGSRQTAAGRLQPEAAHSAQASFAMQQGRGTGDTSEDIVNFDSLQALALSMLPAGFSLDRAGGQDHEGRETLSDDEIANRGSEWVPETPWTLTDGRGARWESLSIGSGKRRSSDLMSASRRALVDALSSRHTASQSTTLSNDTTEAPYDAPRDCDTPDASRPDSGNTLTSPSRHAPSMGREADTSSEQGWLSSVSAPEVLVQRMDSMHMGRRSAAQLHAGVSTETMSSVSASISSARHSAPIESWAHAPAATAAARRAASGVQAATASEPRGDVDLPTLQKCIDALARAYEQANELHRCDVLNRVTSRLYMLYRKRPSRNRRG